MVFAEKTAHHNERKLHFNSKGPQIAGEIAKMWKLTLTVFAMGIAAYSGPIQASMITVRCDDPRGFQLTHGKDHLGRPGYHQEDVAKRFGSRPMFLIDSADPAHVTVIWGGTESFGKELAEKYAPAIAKKARIAYRSADQISAIEKTEVGIYVHTLYPKMGYGVFTEQAHWIGGETISGWIYFAPCKFISE